MKPKRLLLIAGIAAAVVAMMLVCYGQQWALAPFLLGAALGLTLLVVMDRTVRWICTPNRARRSQEKNGGQRGPKAALLGIALIKYPLVAVLICAVTHAWRTELPSLMAFTGGYILIHFVIGARAIGRALFVPSR